MKKILFFMFIWLSFGKLCAQNVTITPNGISPESSGNSPFLKDANSTIYHSYGGNPQDGVVPMPVNGTSSRMMWIPQKAAFRVGRVTHEHWDGNNIGKYSVAMGYNLTAIGNYSFAIGTASHATGDYSRAMGFGAIASGENSTAMQFFTNATGGFSTAMGYSTSASGGSSVAMGYMTKASGLRSFAMGSEVTASGDYSTAMGITTTASGDASTAMGITTTASGLSSTALGYKTTASGDYSTTMGSEVSTNNQKGSFMIGDSDPDNTGKTYAQFPDRMYARFKNGFRFLTSSNNNVTGIVAYGGANAWSTASDSTKKEKFAPINGENILQKIAQFKLATWNYKGQDSRVFRHYGPMAQDFYAAFGHDTYGTIGCDTLINQADFDGINFVAIQALEKRTKELRSTNDDLRITIGEIRSTNDDLRITIGEIRSTNNDLRKTIGELRSTNEDLRITIGEIRSTNNELRMTNNQLQITNNELRNSNEQLEKRLTELECLKSELASIRQALKTDR